MGVKNKHYSFADKLYTPWVPYENEINEIIKKGNKLIRLREDEVKKSYEEYKDKFDIEPSSSVVFVALQKLKFKNEDNVVLINSGKGLM